MQVYRALSRLPFLRGYSSKFLFVAFIGIHIPLLGIISFLLFFPTASVPKWQLVGLVLSLTLLATVVTLAVLKQLTAPIRLVKEALENYLYSQTIPALPVEYTDEAGLLLQDVQHTIVSLDKLLNEKKDTIGLLSHELRGPANSVLSLLELLKAEKDADQAQQYYRHMHQLVTSQLELMTSMLTIIQNEETWQMIADKKPVSFGQLLDAALVHLEGSIFRKGLVVDCQVPPDLKVVVEPQSFGQVLFNVLHNAVKFSNEGGLITLTVHSAMAAERVAITIEDEGIGFRPSYTEELFERFTERRRWGTDNEPTNGIGLYLCRKVMRRHGGDIKAYSRGEGKGAAFTLTLPEATIAAVPALALQ